MATLQTIRNRGGVLVAVIIGLALAAFILGDIVRSGSGIRRKSQMEIGVINGNSIQYPDYARSVEELEEIYKMNSGRTSLDQNTLDQVRDQAWETLVRDNVMSEVYEELGLSVSAEELFDMIQGNNLHPIIRQMFRDPNTGEVNRSNIIAFLKNMESAATPAQKAYWLFMEKQIQDERKLSKYTNLVNKGLYVSSAEVQEEVAAKNRHADIQYVMKRIYSVPDSAVSFTEKELKSYYKNNIENYKQSASRRIDYVSFPIYASEEDDKANLKWITDIKDEFINADDNVSFVNLNSDTPFDGVYQKKEDVSPKLADWAFRSEAGAIYGPYKEAGAYKLVKVDNFKMLPDSVKARHILIRPTNEAEAAIAEATMDSLKNLIQKGSNFATLAKKFSQDPGSAEKGGDLGWFKRGDMVPQFEEACFNGKVKEVQIVRSQFGIHLIQVTNQSRKNKNVLLATLERKIEASTATYQQIFAQASRFAGENQTTEAFNMAVEADKKLIKRSAIVREADREIPGLENSRILIRSAFNNSEAGELVVDYENSPIFELGNEFIVGIVAEEKEEGYMPFEEVRPRIELAVIKEKKAEKLISEWTDASKRGLDAVSVIAGVEVKNADNVSFASVTFPGIGQEPAVIGTISKLKENEVSNPIKGNQGVYVVKVISITETDDQNFKDNQERLIQNLGMRAYRQVYDVQRESAEIEDKRTRFF